MKTFTTTEFLDKYKAYLPDSLVRNFNFEWTVRKTKFGLSARMKIAPSMGIYTSEIRKSLPILISRIALALVKDCRAKRGGMSIRIYNPNSITNPVIIPVTADQDGWTNEAVKAILDAESKHITLYVDVNAT